ncbi:MAG: hypothetical protein U9N85_07605 [Bacteroidota bacterium]|nr:hypothetical protein [Bacteroidota bacterium]
MMKTTFASEGLAGYINQNFIPVRFDAETRDTLIFKGKTYTNKGVGRRPKHELANYLLNGKFSFPTIVYTDRKGNIYPVPGYKDVKSIEPYLIYFTESVYQNRLPINNFVTDFMFANHDRFKKEIDEIKKTAQASNSSFTLPDSSGVVHWQSFNEAAKKQSVDNKPLVVFIHTQRYYTCNLFEKMVLKNGVIADLLNNKYHPVKMNAAAQKDIEFMGKVFKSNGPGAPHQLTYALLKKSFVFPAVLVIDNKNQLAAELHAYMNTVQFESIMSFYADKNYTKKSYQEFVKPFKSKLQNQ